MDAEKYLSEFYWHDRACKAIIIDCWKFKIKIQSTMISRHLSPTSQYVCLENIKDGWLVFDDVQWFIIENEGRMPGDEINEVKVINIQDGIISLEVYISASSQILGKYPEVILRIKCKGMHLEDPKRPGEIIY